MTQPLSWGDECFWNYEAMKHNKNTQTKSMIFTINPVAKNYGSSSFIYLTIVAYRNQTMLPIHKAFDFEIIIGTTGHSK